MKCLRIYMTELETGKSLRKIRVPLAIIRLVVQLLPPRIFELIESDIDGEVGKEIAQAIYKLLVEVDKRGDDEIENGVIIDVEEYSEEYRRTEHTVIFVE